MLIEMYDFKRMWSGIWYRNCSSFHIVINLKGCIGYASYAICMLTSWHLQAYKMVVTHDERLYECTKNH
mgnify:CR=1 FL=1